MSKLGEKVKELRLGREWTHARSGEECGIQSVSFFSALETGRKKYIQFGDIEALAKGFDVSLTVLLECLPPQAMANGNRYIPLYQSTPHPSE